MIGSTVVSALDEAVLRDLEEALDGLKHLRAVVPAEFPRDPRFAISHQKMVQFSDQRMAAYWHHLNLPLALHAARHGDDDKVRQLMTSVLTALDDFVARLGHLPGASTLLSPLWDDPWTPTPQLWSVASCAYMALSYQTHGIEVVGFESAIAGGKIDDITLRMNGTIVHFEVEAWHRAALGAKSDAELVQRLEERAIDKAKKKFTNINAGERGVVAEVCVVAGVDVDRHLSLSGRPVPGFPGSIGWMACRLVGVAHPDGLKYAVMPL